MDKEKKTTTTNNKQQTKTALYKLQNTPEIIIIAVGPVL